MISRPAAPGQLASVGAMPGASPGRPWRFRRAVEPASLGVHDISLYDPLRKAIRTRHVRLRFARHRS